MNNLFKENKFLSNKPLLAFILFVYVLLLIPFLGNVAFDAVVHFVVAERFAEGHPFIFNIHDTEKVIASTSPFWTIILTFIFYISGHLAPFVVKSICIILWLAAGYLLNIAARDIWKLSNYARIAVLLIWFANISIVKNSLGCLENILCAFQLLLLYIYLHKNAGNLNIKISIVTGLLTGWTLLTRVDAGALALLFVIIFIFSVFSLQTGRNKNLIVSFFVILSICLIILLPWYLFQYSCTSKILSDSSVARLFTGRRNSIPLFSGALYFHPNPLTILFTAYIPLTIGFLLTLSGLKFKELKNNFYKVSALLAVIFSVIAYTFIVGADQFGRYFLICMPFFLLAGISGLQKIYLYIKGKSTPAAGIFTAVIVLFLLSANSYDYYKRVIKIEQIESNVFETYLAPGNRNKVTTEYLEKLGFGENDTIKLAVTEVQFKYFVDERVDVISLDGRSSAKILKYMNKEGMPDFERFIDDVKPDVIEVKGWNYKGNLLNEWNEKLNNMKIGESFMWKNNRVTYVMPWHVRIYYNIK